MQAPEPQPSARLRPHEPVTTLRLAFLDEDHVLGLTQQILEAKSVEEWSTVLEFFRPEVPALPELMELRRGVDASVGPLSADTDVLIFRRGSVDSSTLDAAPSLRLIQRIGRSSAPVDVSHAWAMGAEMSFLRRRGIEMAAEHTIMLMLALVKRVVVGDRAVRDHLASPGGAAAVSYNWPGITGVTGLSGKVLGIVGLGEVGTHVARSAHALGMTVVYANRRPLDASTETELGATHMALADLLRAADVVTLHVPGSHDQPVLGRAELELMSPTTYVVNTSRGWLIDEDALVDALAGGRIAGAALDVHAREPRVAGDPLLALDNVILTPHIAGGSRLGVLDEVRDVFDNLRDAMNGRPPRHGRWEVGP